MTSRRVIGLRPAHPENPNAYPARQQATKTGRGPALVAGTLFTQHIDLDTSVAYRWVPTVEDDILCIDISEPGKRATSNRSRAREVAESVDT